MAFLLTSCEKPANPSEDNTVAPSDSINDKGGANEPDSPFELVKFTDDKYREYILAANQVTYACLLTSKPNVAEELIVGTIPCDIKLPNGYWVINWRWCPVMLWSDICVLLPYKWETLKHWNQTWNLPDTIMPFHQYIEDVGFTSRRVIDEYLSLNQDVKPFSHEESILYKYYGGWYDSMNEISNDEDKDEYLKYIYLQDSLHIVYAQRLAEIINKGDFEKVINQ